MSSIASTIATHLLQINAIKLSPQNPFTWASGIQSPIYCDNRITLSYPAVRKSIVDAFVEKSKTMPAFDIIAGVATAGIPHGALLAYALDVPFIYVRSKPKAHGRQNQIEGELKEGQRVLVIEDLISTGGSSLKAVEAVREAGGNVTSALAIFSYGFEQATQAFADAACPFDTLSNYDALLEVAIATNYVKPDEVERLKAWRKNPKAWK